MDIKNILNLKKKKTNFEEFLNFAFDQPIPFQFRSLNYMPLEFQKINDQVELYQCEADKLYFILEYTKQPILIYEIEMEKNLISEVKCVNKNEFKNLLVYLANNIKLSSIPN